MSRSEVQSASHRAVLKREMRSVWATGSVPGCFHAASSTRQPSPLSPLTITHHSTLPHPAPFARPGRATPRSGATPEESGVRRATSRRKTVTWLLRQTLGCTGRAKPARAVPACFQPRASGAR
ncbi:hypothetical protein T484DRAFT_2780251 [Baffinella frigidus]|nr:hypothetical protein T484DRAFT_2780251 [Cryptophyta sp. CCMP2293]